MFVAIGLDMLYPQVTKIIINEVLVSGDMDRLAGLLGIILLCGVGRCVCGYFKEITFDRTGSTIGTEMRKDLFGHIQGLSLDFFDKNNSIFEFFMQIITTKSELIRQVNACTRQGKTIGFVPTMGALHAGHASLIQRACSENEVCYVSVFVNPTQFNNAEDLLKYPRNLEKDAALLEALGVHFVFAPTPEEMYSKEEMEQPFSFDFNGLDQVMEGKMRPGHFNGVVQVVSRLFDLVQPTRAYFGEKDFQQLAIIRHMVERSSLAERYQGLQIIGCPIVRETNGLAMSSRNERLSEQEKQIAVGISQTLLSSLEWAKTASVSQVQQQVIDTINAIEGLEVEYYDIVDKTTLQPTDSFENAVGCVTVYCGPVRLIDNIQY
jgi:pantoate--beta-alanine ligase